MVVKANPLYMFVLVLCVYVLSGLSLEGQTQSDGDIPEAVSGLWPGPVSVFGAPGSLRDQRERLHKVEH